MSFYTGFGGFMADVRAAEKAGITAQECPSCGAWVWTDPGSTPYKCCTTRKCEIARCAERIGVMEATKVYNREFLPDYRY